MSTKIYCAYRMRSEDLCPFVHDAVRLGHESVKKKFEEIIKFFSENVDVNSDDYKRFTKAGHSPSRTRYWIADKTIRDSYYNQLSSNRRNAFDFSVFIDLYMYQDYIYLIPSCDMEMRHALDFLKEDPRLSDFSYYNNTDMPSNISIDEWEQRRQTWDEIFKNSDDMLTLEILSPRTFLPVFASATFNETV